jgi:hypothetical protein
MHEMKALSIFLKALQPMEGTEKLIIKLGLVQSCLYKPFCWGYLRNNKQFGSDKQFSERLFRIYPSILSPIFSKGTFSVPSANVRLFYLIEVRSVWKTFFQQNDLRNPLC